MLLFLSLSVITPTALAASKESLAEVQQQIKHQQISIADHHSKLSQLTAEARQQDKKLAQAVLEHRKVQKQLLDSQAHSRELNNSISALQANITAQKKDLGQQIETIYMEGQMDYLKLLLTQDTPSSIERNLSYYEYLTNGRVELINQLSSDEKMLAQQRHEHNELQQQLVQLEQQHRSQNQLLLKQLKQTKVAQTKLREWLKDEQQQLASLVESEKRITKQLIQLEKQRSANINLAKNKGQLPWPIEGKKLYNYGERRAGHLTWKGWLIKARAGEEVSAIAPGKVIYSDWLNGLGMVIVLDHGQNYLSLYGHNQALLHDVGSQVGAGEVVALSGNSGNEPTPGVYFELRHKGQPQDPRKWLR